jgi:hypothetical protein
VLNVKSSLVIPEAIIDFAESISATFPQGGIPWGVISLGIYIYQGVILLVFSLISHYVFLLFHSTHL